MKRIRIIFLALAVSCSPIFQLSSFGQDQPQPDTAKKEDKGSHHGDKKNLQNSKQAHPQSVEVVTPKNNKKNSQKTFDTSRQANTTVQSNDLATRDVQRQPRHASQQIQNQSTQVVVEGNRGNRYNNRWFVASTHSDWDRGSVHEWNHHHYRWYDGGWLIFDVSPSVSYYHTDSLGFRVQERLTDQGYYYGPIDGDIGPGTRRAIANYQADHGLYPTGQINDRLLVSLGLE